MQKSNALSPAMERDSPAFFLGEIVHGKAHTAEDKCANAMPVIGHLPFWLSDGESARGACSFDWPAGFRRRNLSRV
jgi:hypothetical protein